MEEHHRFLLATQLRRLEAIEQDIATLDLRITERLEPYRMPHALLMQIPGVDWLVAAVLIAEIGVDMSVFLSVYHLSAWAGVCPGSHESAGRQKSGRARKGNVLLRTILVGAAISAAKDQGQLPQGQIPPSQGPPRRHARGPRHRPQDSRQRLSHARQRAVVPRPRRSLSRPDQSNPHRRKPEAPA
jgi:hypothetical protein